MFFSVNTILPRIGLLLDTAHMVDEEKDPIAAVRAAGSWLKHVQAPESDRGTPGSGTLIDWPGLFRALHDIDYRGGCAIESFAWRDPAIAARTWSWRPLAASRCSQIMGPRLMSAEGPATAETRQVFGFGFNRMLQAHLLTANGIGIELFEPLDPPPLPREPGLCYRGTGPWHFALQHPDVDAMVDRIVAKGEHRHSDTHAFAPGRPWRLAYARDPWWTTIEIVSHSYAEMFGNWPQPGARTQATMVDRAEAERLRAGAIGGSLA